MEYGESCSFISSIRKASICKLNKMPYEKAPKRIEVIFKETNDEFNVRVASKPEEIKALLEVEFEYVCEKDDFVFFRKCKSKSYIKIGKN
jgi:hypothetical protein